MVRNILRERERKRIIEIFKINRKYREFVDRLGVEMVDDYSEYKPCSEIEITIIIDDENTGIKHLSWVVMGVAVDNYADDRNDLITYMIMTDNTEVDRTIPDDDMVHDKYDVIENSLTRVKDELRGEIHKKVTSVTETIIFSCLI